MFSLFEQTYYKLNIGLGRHDADPQSEDALVPDLQAVDAIAHVPAPTPHDRSPAQDLQNFLVQCVMLVCLQ